MAQRIIWLSANLFGLKLLKQALKVCPHEIIAVVTLDEGAKTRMYDGVDINKWKKFNLPVYKIVNINDDYNLIKKLKPDLIVMCGWRQILGKEILKLPRNGVIAFHPTLLPIGRGPAPIINSILEGFKKSGVTMFYAADGVDDGDIIGQAGFQIGENDNAKNVYLKVIKAGKKLIKKYLPLLVKGKAPRILQKGGSYFTPRTIKDNEITLKDSPEIIYRKIKAFSWPYRGAFIRVGKKKLIIWEAELKANE